MQTRTVLLFEDRGGEARFVRSPKRLYLECVRMRHVKSGIKLLGYLVWSSERPYRAGKAISACSLALLDGHFHEK